MFGFELIHQWMNEEYKNIFHDLMDNLLILLNIKYKNVKQLYSALIIRIVSWAVTVKNGVMPKQKVYSNIKHLF